MYPREWALILFTAWCVCPPSSQEEPIDYETDYSGDYEGSFSGDYNYSYSYDEYANEVGRDDSDHDLDESEVLYVPQMLSEAHNFNVSIGDSVDLPCLAKDSSEFVRIWMKEADILFTGGVQTRADPRYSLPDEWTLRIKGILPSDSGAYTCRIMLRDEIRVTHRVQVIEEFSISPVPSHGRMVGRLGDSLILRCRVFGRNTDELGPRIIWRREGYKFANGKHTYEGEEYQIANASREDAGTYFCSIQLDADVKLTSLEVSIQFPPKVVAMEKSLVRSGLGKAFELTCVILGEPQPKVTWYRGNEVMALDNKITASEAGTKYVLTFEKVQNDDIGRYMCYATNDLGSSQKTIEVSIEDIETERVDLDRGLDQDEEVSGHVETKLAELQAFWTKEKALMVILQDKVMLEINALRNASRSASNGGSSDSFDLSLFSDLERLQMQLSRLQDAYNKDITVLQEFSRSTKDDAQRIWDNVNELQELTNVTARHVEDIYDKDILKLQNFQSGAEGDLNRIQSDVGNLIETMEARLESNGISSSINKDLSQKLTKMTGDFQRIGSRLDKVESSNQLLREDIQRVFHDIDDLKKFKQDTERANEVLQREINQLEMDQITELFDQFRQNGRVLEELLAHRDKVDTEIPKAIAQSDERFSTLTAAIQKLKGQMYYLQQSFIQTRIAQTLPGNGSQIREGSATPSAQGLAWAKKLAHLQGRVEQCVGYELFEQLVKEVATKEVLIDSQFTAQDDRLDYVKEQSKSNQDGLRDTNDHLDKLDRRLDGMEANIKKYNLIFRGLQPQQKLERPHHVEDVIVEFAQTHLELSQIQFDEASRIANSKLDPKPILVKFPNIREKIRVLNQSRLIKSARVTILEDFTDRVILHRRRLSAFARRRARIVRKKWALKYDKLYFNGRVFAFDEASNRVVPQGKIDAEIE